MITFAEYRDAGGTGTLEEFGERMAFIWPIIDDTVMHRWDDIPAQYRPDVDTIVARMLDDYDAIKEEEQGGRVTSFSNGVASYGFASSTDAAAGGIAQRYINAIVRMLPVSIVSRVIGGRR